MITLGDFSVERRDVFFTRAFLSKVAKTDTQTNLRQPGGITYNDEAKRERSPLFQLLFFGEGRIQPRATLGALFYSDTAYRIAQSSLHAVSE